MTRHGKDGKGFMGYFGDPAAARRVDLYWTAADEG